MKHISLIWKIWSNWRIYISGLLAKPGFVAVVGEAVEVIEIAGRKTINETQL